MLISVKYVLYSVGLPSHVIRGRGVGRVVQVQRERRRKWLLEMNVKGGRLKKIVPPSEKGVYFLVTHYLKIGWLNL